MKNQKYESDMEPWPEIKQFARKIILEKTNLEVFYYEAGKDHRDHILLIHGLGDEADTWRHIIHPLSKEFHLIAFDLPGFGRSDKPDRQYTPQFFLSVIDDLMETLSIDRAFLLGSSLGGMFAQGFALEKPKKVEGLILVDGTLYQQGSMGDSSLQLMRMPVLGEWLYTRLRKNPEAAFNSLHNVYHNLDEMPQEDRDFLYQRVNNRVWSDGQRRAYFSTLRQMAGWVKKSQIGLAELLRKLNIPSLIIRGEFDPLFTEASADAMIKIQDNVAKVIINDAGHLPHQETPLTFINPVLTWLRYQRRKAA